MKTTVYFRMFCFGVLILIGCGGCGASTNERTTTQGLLKTNPIQFINSFTDAGFKKNETPGASPEQKNVWLLSPDFGKVPFNLVVHFANANNNEIDSVYCEYDAWNKESNAITSKYLFQVMQGIFPKENEVLEVYQEIISKFQEAAKQQTSLSAIKFKRGEINISANFLLLGNVVKSTLQFDTLPRSEAPLAYKEKVKPDIVPSAQVKEFFLLDTNKINPGGKIKVYESQIPNYYRYINGRFAFSIDFPQMLSVALEAGNSGGVRFSSSDREIQLSVYGSHNSAQITNRAAYSHMMNSKINGGYSATGDDWNTVSWKENGKIFYQKEFISPQYINGFLLEYPEGSKVNCEDIIINLDKTFIPGWYREKKIRG